MQTTTDTRTHTTTDPTPGSSSVTPVRVTLLIGSNRTGRFGPVIAEWLLDRVRRHDGFEVEVVDVAEADLLPTTFATTPESTARLAGITPKLAAAEAFIVLTPEYNHSYPAALKNLIDWHFHEWRAKPVALVSYGGMSGGLRAAEHLRQVFAELHAVTVRDTVSFHQAHAAFDETGHLKDPSAPDAAARLMLDQLAWWAQALREAKERRPYGG
ncbi:MULTISPECIES: NADPH-dependent FMN reductase [Streptomyces]|uniref:FMN-dependent NADPH-azoreductase n=1 Tax=Streptomyces scabiei TaxID=1930 RepID=A0A100JPX4_STRSC|nr:MULTISPECIES: NAD(P)H-dependent oxidoreductase [Streptomyces]MDX3070672.1 NAD(P)H-dependent oxidoreductase [Streptomyces sp. ND04-05B]GAQ63525.1 FMN-dependent NADPH-azoreductase [Streptomyces scabiei]